MFNLVRHRLPRQLLLSPARPGIAQIRLYSGSDYGSPGHKDDPAAKPRSEQGASESEGKQHPGPPPPKGAQPGQESKDEKKDTGKKQ